MAIIWGQKTLWGINVCFQLDVAPMRYVSVTQLERRCVDMNHLR